MYMEVTLRQGDYREDRRALFESNAELQQSIIQNEILGFLDLSALGGVNVRNLSFQFKLLIY